MDDDTRLSPAQGRKKQPARTTRFFRPYRDWFLFIGETPALKRWAIGEDKNICAFGDNLTSSSEGSIHLGEPYTGEGCAGWLGSVGSGGRTACLIKPGMRLARLTISFVITLTGFCTSSDVLTAQ